MAEDGDKDAIAHLHFNRAFQRVLYRGSDLFPTDSASRRTHVLASRPLWWISFSSQDSLGIESKTAGRKAGRFFL